MQGSNAIKTQGVTGYEEFDKETLLRCKKQKDE